jgi:hypothetical protein
VTLAIFLLHLEIGCHHRKPERAKYSTNKQQESSEKQILIRQRVGQAVGGN